MAATATLQIKIEPELKSEAVKYFAEVGTSISTAVRMFLQKTLQARSVTYNIADESKVEEAWRVEEEQLSWEPKPELAKFLRKTNEDIEAGRNLIKFNSNEEALAYFDRRMKKK